MKRFRFRPTYSNVVATLALFFALAGGAWAATRLPRESVGSTQLKNGAVTPAKLSAQAKKGFAGARGEAGAQGALGPRGNEGQRGGNGAAGATGPQGIRGATGATGATGKHGEPGEEGERGLTGGRGEKGETGPIGPSDAYFDISEPQANEVTHAPEVPNIPLKVQNLPAGEYVLQAVLTVQGTAAPAVAECKFGGDEPGITLGLPVPFLTDVALGGYASLVGTTTAVVTEQSTAYVTCEAAVAGTSFLIPAESGHLTVTKVGALHPPTP